MIMRIDHIGIAVRNISEALKVYRDVIGLKFVKIEEVPEEKVKIAMLKVGETYIELLEPLSSESALAKFLDKRGEGIHHIAFAVNNIDEAMQKVKANGVDFIYDKPRELHDRKINFIHPKFGHGVLLELVERLEVVE